MWNSDMRVKGGEDLLVKAVSTWKERSAMSHTKIYASILQDPDNPSAPVLARWLMMGSHNISKVAHGLGQRVVWRIPEGEKEEKAYVIEHMSSWELSVLIIPPRPRVFSLPFDLHSRQWYRGDGADVPCSPTSLNELYTGSGQAKERAEAEVAAAYDALSERHRWAVREGLSDHEGRPPSPILVPFGGLDEHTRLVLFAKLGGDDDPPIASLKLYEGRNLDLPSRFLFNDVLCRRETAEAVDDIFGGLLGLCVGSSRGLEHPHHGDALCVHLNIPEGGLPALVLVRGGGRKVVVQGDKDVVGGPMSIGSALKLSEEGNLGVELRRRADAWVKSNPQKTFASQFFGSLSSYMEEIMVFVAQWMRKFRLFVLEPEGTLKSPMVWTDSEKLAQRHFMVGMVPMFGGGCVPLFQRLSDTEEYKFKVGVLSGIGIDKEYRSKYKLHSPEEKMAKCMASVKWIVKEFEKRVWGGAHEIDFGVALKEEELVQQLRKMAEEACGSELTKTLVIGSSAAGPRTREVAGKVGCRYIHCEQLWGLAHMMRAGALMRGTMTMDRAKEEVFAHLDDVVWGPDKGPLPTNPGKVKNFFGGVKGLPNFGVEGLPNNH
mmetsp:Transcript_1057/g.2430  ORF Transcript_1057/g.2430 Transcript_1057/m.2430 type:complete len:602 (+) Transcript_1057:334-2139(+)